MRRSPVRVALLATLVALLASCSGGKAGPRPVKDAEPGATAPPPPEPVDLVLVVDLSKSMEETDLPPDRLGATTTALRALVAHARRDRIGAVIYAQQVKLLASLSADHAELDDALDRLRVGDIAELGTAMGDGLALAVEQLATSTAKRRAVILLADGDWNMVIKSDPDQAAAAAAAAGIKVFTVLVGREDGAFGAMAVNPKPLQTIARTTDAVFYRATDPASLAASLETIRRVLHDGP